MRFHELNEVERDIEKLRRAVKQDPTSILRVEMK